MKLRLLPTFATAALGLAGWTALALSCGDDKDKTSQASAASVQACCASGAKTSAKATASHVGCPMSKDASVASMNAGSGACAHDKNAMGHGPQRQLRGLRNGDGRRRLLALRLRRVRRHGDLRGAAQDRQDREPGGPAPEQDHARLHRRFSGARPGAAGRDGPAQRSADRPGGPRATRFISVRNASSCAERWRAASSPAKW